MYASVSIVLRTYNKTEKLLSDEATEIINEISTHTHFIFCYKFLFLAYIYIFL